MKDDTRDIKKLLGTDPGEVLRMGRLEARKYFRALVNEANERLERLEREHLTMSDAYVEHIGTLRTVKGKKRFTVPTDENLANDEIRNELLYQLHDFLGNPSSKPESAKKQKARLKEIFAGVLEEYRLREAWAVIDELRLQFPERFGSGDSDKIIKEIIHNVVKKGILPDDVKNKYRDTWIKQFQELSQKDKEFAQKKSEYVEWLRDVINDPKYKDIFTASVDFDYNRKKSPYSKGFFEV